MKIIHRRYVAHGDAHYAGNLVDGAFGLAMFGDVATDLSIALDGHEGLFAGYSSVDFVAPVRGGDMVEAEAELIEKGTRGRRIDFTLRVVCRADGHDGHSSVLAEPIIATRAQGTVVVPRETVVVA